MKKYILLIPILLVPYSILFGIYCIYSGFLMESVFQNNAYLLILALIAFWLVARICDIFFCVEGMIKECNPNQLALANMLLKVIQIPAYVLIFLIGSACMLTIFTFAISFFLFLLDVMSIFLSGMVGFVAVKANQASLSRKEFVLHGVLQFVFCADVVSAIIVFRKAVAEKRKRTS